MNVKCRGCCELTRDAERPIRSFETITDVTKSWIADKTVNVLMAKKTTLAPKLSRAVSTDAQFYNMHIKLTLVISCRLSQLAHQYAVASFNGNTNAVNGRSGGWSFESTACGSQSAITYVWPR